MELAILVGVLGYQAWVTRSVVRADHLSREQRFAQLASVWCVPAVGAVLCHWFLRLHATSDPPNETKFVQRDGLDPAWFRGPNDDQ